VRHLARQQLPAGNLREVYQAIAILLEFTGRAVESFDGATDFVAALRRNAGLQVSGSNFRQPGSELADGWLIRLAR